jgi:NADH:ubiquinone oxidoreductase subunit C
MITSLISSETIARLNANFGDSLKVTETCLYIKNVCLADLAALLKDTPGLDYHYLEMITAADYPDRFELIYQFLSLINNRLCVVKTSCGKVAPAVPSLAPLWQGADFQEREIFDLFGIRFVGHPALRRIVLWEGFTGHPLRKDFRHGA